MGVRGSGKFNRAGDAKACAADQNIDGATVFLNPGKDPADGFFVRSGIARGMPIRVAELLKVSPQSARGTLKAAGVYEERNLIIAALGLLHDRRERT